MLKGKLKKERLSLFIKVISIKPKNLRTFLATFNFHKKLVPMFVAVAFSSDLDDPGVMEKPVNNR